MANIIPTEQSDDIRITLNSVADNLALRRLKKDGNVIEGLGLKLTGEVLDLEGFLSNDATYSVRRLEEAQGLSSHGDWCYYAGRVASSPAHWLKVWIRWNLEKQIYDYYLEAEAGVIFDHVTPYLGTVR